ncbi:MAG: four helix bundle protein [Bacteroidales bacterium]|nr:four helix bundle protein [Bacteroidales bacterium]
MSNSLNLDDFSNSLAKRLFEFATDVIRFLGSLASTPEAKIIRYQLAKSSSSSGANYEEAQAGSSKADFTNKVRIALREMRESNYWLRLLKSSDQKCNTKERDKLILESRELKNILGSIVQKMRD